jgi:hypothetical protein
MYEANIFYSNTLITNIIAIRSCHDPKNAGFYEL